MVDEKALKAAKKEGGKKGVDAAGMSDLGGVKYFHITVDTPEGDVELLRAVLEVRVVDLACPIMLHTPPAAGQPTTTPALHPPPPRTRA